MKASTHQLPSTQRLGMRDRRAVAPMGAAHYLLSKVAEGFYFDRSATVDLASRSLFDEHVKELVF